MLTNLVMAHHSTYQIAKILNISQTNVRYWLKKYGLRTDYKKIPKCGKCGETDPDKFYGCKKKICGRCHNQDVLIKGKEKRSKAVKHLGGRCLECGYNEYECSLDIHHIYPSKKDPNFGSMRGWSWKRIYEEIKYCILLCRNCHHALHCGHQLAVAKLGIAPGLGPGDRKFESCQPESCG